MSINLIKYLDLVKELQKFYPTYDIHLHPVEIFSNSDDYVQNKSINGLFHRDRRAYNSPRKDSLCKIDLCTEVEISLNTDARKVKFLNRMSYSHSGPVVFGNLFQLGGLDKGLLLPVAPEHEDIRGQMESIAAMFKGDSRFFMATSVPNFVTNDEIVSYLIEDKNRFDVIAQKIHPNITNIDAASRNGKMRIERLIQASAEVNLPAIIHTGLSFIPSSDQKRNTAINAFIDMEIPNTVPVIFAHGGCFGHSAVEIESNILPNLKRILKKHSNTYVDVSGLGLTALTKLIDAVDYRRILFGSDGLYVSPVVILLKLIAAVKNSGKDVEQYLIHILSENPDRTLFRDVVSHKIGNNQNQSKSEASEADLKIKG
jgi:predicted TIM-barrel fold metal-dependent hydrolase